MPYDVVVITMLDVVCTVLCLSLPCWRYIAVCYGGHYCIGCILCWISLAVWLGSYYTVRCILQFAVVVITMLYV